MAQGRVKDLESLFHRSEAELAAALSDKRGLESDVAELRAQLAKAGLGGGGPVWGRPGAGVRVPRGPGGARSVGCERVSSLATARPCV